MLLLPFQVGVTVLEAALAAKDAEVAAMRQRLPPPTAALPDHHAEVNLQSARSGQ